MNRARLCLMRHLGWTRMAVLASTSDRGIDQGYARVRRCAIFIRCMVVVSFHVSNIFFPLLCLKAASDLAVLSDKYQMNISLDYLGGLFMEAQPLFYKWQERHYKIIMLLLQPLGARQVLCQVKGHQSTILECAEMWVWPVKI